MMPPKKPPAVEPDGVPAREIRSVLDATENGKPIDELLQVRKVIARALDNEDTSARDLASLSRRLMEVSNAIAVLRKQESEDKNDASNIPDEPFDKASI